MKNTFFFIVFTLLFSCTYGQTIIFDSQEYETINVLASNETMQGENVLKVERDLKNFPLDSENLFSTIDEPTFVKLTNANFQNGIINVKVLSRLVKGAPNFARGFIGLAFRINEDNSKFESIYIRPTNGRANDQLRRNHSVQYFSYPDYKFNKLRTESPGKYESYADMGLDEWIQMKIVVKDNQAQLFLHNEEQPVMVINDLKHGSEQKGAIGLWVEIGTEGYFKDLHITKFNASEVLSKSEVKESQFFTTSDGVRLHYRVAGTGPNLVILPGYGQDASKFDDVYKGLQEHFTIYTLDYRWLGKSDSPEYGAQISRFAMDTHEMIADANIDRFYLFAHSMGNTVAWNYFSLFGQKKVVKYILGDEAPCLITNPSWTAEENETYTGSPQYKDLWTAWRKPNPTTRAGEKKINKTIQKQMMEKLLTTHLSNDWRDIIPTIRIPTLILMGGKSHFASQKLWHWLHTSIKNSELKIIEEGGHGYYETHPDVFNKSVLNFFKQ